MKFIETTLTQFMVEGAKRYHSGDFRYQIVYNPIVKKTWTITGPRVKVADHDSLQGAIDHAKSLNKKRAVKKVVCAKDYLAQNTKATLAQTKSSPKN